MGVSQILDFGFMEKPQKLIVRGKRENLSRRGFGFSSMALLTSRYGFAVCHFRIEAQMP